MPWKECHVMDERLRFVARLLKGEDRAAVRPVRDLAEMPHREGPSGPHLQVPVEGHGAWFVGELDYDVDVPWPSTGRGHAAPFIMACYPRERLTSVRCNTAEACWHS